MKLFDRWRAETSRRDRSQLPGSKAKRYRWVGGLSIAAGIVLAIADGRVMTLLLPIGPLPVIDIADLERPETPNHFLVCPADLCRAPDAPAPVFEQPVSELEAAFQTLVATEKRMELLRRDPALAQMDYVQRSRLLRFPDLVSVRFIALGPKRSTLALYSRSIYGRSDLGVNRARILDWLAKLGQ